MPADPEGTGADTGADTGRAGRGRRGLLFRPVVLAEVHLRLDGFIPGLAKGGIAAGIVLAEIVEAAEHVEEVCPVIIAQHCCIRWDTEGFVDASGGIDAWRSVIAIGK